MMASSGIPEEFLVDQFPDIIVQTVPKERHIRVPFRLARKGDVFVSRGSLYPF
jgi:hypothetical protein